MNNCKKKRILLIAAAVAVIVLGAVILDYCRINGREIKNIDRLSQVSVYIRAESANMNSAQEPKENNDSLIIQLSTDQVKQLQTLLKENTYKRRFTDRTPANGNKYNYLVFADWDNNGAYNLFVYLMDNGYISFGRSNIYHEIKNPEFIDDFVAIID